MQPQAQQPQMINIDGIQYDFASLGPEIQNTIALMEYARQQVQTAQMELASRTSAHSQIGAQLREMLQKLPKGKPGSVPRRMNTASGKRATSRKQSRKR